MNEQDMINLILGEPEDDFHGTVPSKDKRLRFDRLRGHAGARCRCDGRRRGPGHLRPDAGPRGPHGGHQALCPRGDGGEGAGERHACG